MVHAEILSNKNKEEDVNEKFSICHSHWPSTSDKHGTFLQKNHKGLKLHYCKIFHTYDFTSLQEICIVGASNYKIWQMNRCYGYQYFRSDNITTTKSSDMQKRKPKNKSTDQRKEKTRP